MKTKCSVIIATYNGEKFIEEQLNSIINQKYCPDEIIISDDGSVDNTLDICYDILKKSGIAYKINRNSMSKGVTYNFIDASEQSNGEIVFFSDQDDLWCKDKIEKVMNLFLQNPDCMEVMTNAYIWNYDPKKPIRDCCRKTLFDLITIPKIDEEGKADMDEFWNISINKNVVTGMSMAVRRRVVKYWEKEKFSNPLAEPLMMFHDSYYNLVASSLGNVYFIEQPLAFYRQHFSNVQGIKKKLSLSAIRSSKVHVMKSIKKCKQRIDIIYTLDRKHRFLSKENKIRLKNVQQFNINREHYIHHHKFIKMIFLVLKNEAYYGSSKLQIRDLLVTLLPNK